MSEDNKENKSHTGLIAGISAALAASAVYFYGPEGDKHRRTFKSWMLKTKGEVLEQLEDAEKVSKEKYYEFVDKAIDKFAKERAEKEAQIEMLRKELREEWAVIKERAQEKGEELKDAAVEEISKKAEELADEEEEM